MSIVSYGFFCLTGTIGFYACYIFVRQIYSAVKVSSATNQYCAAPGCCGRKSFLDITRRLACVRRLTEAALALGRPRDHSMLDSQCEAVWTGSSPAR